MRAEGGLRQYTSFMLSRRRLAISPHFNGRIIGAASLFAAIYISFTTRAPPARPPLSPMIHDSASRLIKYYFSLKCLPRRPYRSLHDSPCRGFGPLIAPLCLKCLCSFIIMAVRRRPTQRHNCGIFAGIMRATALLLLMRFASRRRRRKKHTHTLIC